MASKDSAELEASVLLGGDKDKIAKADEVAQRILGAQDNAHLYSLIEFLTYTIRDRKNDAQPRHIAIFLNERPEIAEAGLKLTENYVQNILEWIGAEEPKDGNAELHKTWIEIYEKSSVYYRFGILNGFARQPVVNDVEEAKLLIDDTARVQKLLPSRVPKGVPKMFEPKS